MILTSRQFFEFPVLPFYEGERHPQVTGLTSHWNSEAAGTRQEQVARKEGATQAPVIA
jgi:hypothetical protein